MKSNENDANDAVSVLIGIFIIIIGAACSIASVGLFLWLCINAVGVEVGYWQAVAGFCLGVIGMLFLAVSARIIRG